MTPTTYPSFDLQPLIYRNCNIFAGPHGDIDIVSQLDDSQRWHVHVVKNERNKRSCILSESADTLQRAFERLHEKSARAVDKYVATNGFALPPTDREARLSMKSDKSTSPLEDSEVIALCGSSCDEFSDSDSDDSLDNFSPRLETRRLNRSSRQEAKTSSRPRDSAPPRRPIYSEERELVREGFKPAYTASFAPFSPERRQPLAAHPMPSWGRPMSLPPRPPPPGPAQFAPGPASFGIPPPGAPPRLTPPPKIVPVLLNISWPGHGSRKLLASCMPTKQAISSVALMLLKDQPRQFQNVTAEDALPHRLRSLRAVVQRVIVRGEPYEVCAFGNDFSGLVGDGKMVIGFDVEIKKGPPPTMEAPPLETADIVDA